MWPFKKKHTHNWVEEYRREWRMHDALAWRKCECGVHQVSIVMAVGLLEGDKTGEVWGTVPEEEYYRTLKLAKEKDGLLV